MRLIALLVAFVLVIAVPASATAILPGVWYGSIWSGPAPATLGAGSSGTGPAGTAFFDPGAGPWTVTVVGGGYSLLVVDCCASGDRFEVFDFGSSLGLTSASAPGATFCDDPVLCLADPGFSQGSFPLADGSYSFSITTVSGSQSFGEAFFTVAAVPEPGTLGLVFLAGSALLAFRRRL